MNRDFTISFRHSDGSTDAYKANAAGPVAAINQFHRHMQRAKRVSRDAYTITKLTHSFMASDGGFKGVRWVDSEFDLPGGPNPNLLAEAPPPAETATFDFMSDPAFAPYTNASKTATDPR